MSPSIAGEDKMDGGSLETTSAPGISSSALILSSGLLLFDNPKAEIAFW